VKESRDVPIKQKPVKAPPKPALHRESDSFGAIWKAKAADICTQLSKGVFNETITH
jgi:hypothetical protein